MPKGLGAGRKGRKKRVIYYCLSLFGILLLRFMVSPKSDSERTVPILPSRLSGHGLADAVPQPAATKPCAKVVDKFSKGFSCVPAFDPSLWCPFLPSHWPTLKEVHCPEQ